MEYITPNAVLLSRQPYQISLWDPQSEAAMSVTVKEDWLQSFEVRHINVIRAYNPQKHNDHNKAYEVDDGTFWHW